MGPICPELHFSVCGWENLFFLFSIERRRKIWKRCADWDTINRREYKKIEINFWKGIRTMGFKIQIKKKEKKRFSNPPTKRICNRKWIIFLSILDRIWRHGQVVRRGTANPLSPVQIRVSPDQQKTWDFLSYWSNSTNSCPAEAEAKA